MGLPRVTMIAKSMPMVTTVVSIPDSAHRQKQANLFARCARENIEQNARGIPSPVDLKRLRPVWPKCWESVVRVAWSLLTSILSTIMTLLSSMNTASMITEKLVLMISPRTLNTTSSSDGTIVMKKTASSLSAAVSDPVEKLGAAKSPPLCSCSLRAVASPNVKVWFSGTSSIMRRTNDSLSSANTCARSGASSSAL